MGRDDIWEGTALGRGHLSAEEAIFYVHEICGGPGKSGMGIFYLVLDKEEGAPYAVKTFQDSSFEALRP